MIELYGRHEVEGVFAQRVYDTCVYEPSGRRGGRNDLTIHLRATPRVISDRTTEIISLHFHGSIFSSSKCNHIEIERSPSPLGEARKRESGRLSAATSIISARVTLSRKMGLFGRWVRCCFDDGYSTMITSVRNCREFLTVGSSVVSDRFKIDLNFLCYIRRETKMPPVRKLASSTKRCILFHPCVLYQIPKEPRKRKKKMKRKWPKKFPP